MQCIKVLVTNRITWEVGRIVRGYRHRWTGTEIFHRDGKQQLGLGDCQLRDVQGQTRHMYLVMVAYSLLMGELKQGLRGSGRRSADDHRRSLSGDGGGSLADDPAWAIEQVTERDQPMVMSWPVGGT